jgi:two-component system, response regulator PdtaR
MTSAEEPASTSASPNTQTSNEWTTSELLIGKRVVICEDEGVTQLQLSRLLKKAGLILVGAVNNGKAGVETVLRERPDIVLMDIRMPIMDGLEAMEQILAEYPVCVVMLTAFADAEPQKRAEELGSAGYLIKPITSAVLLSTLEKCYRNYQAGKPV